MRFLTLLLTTSLLTVTSAARAQEPAQTPTEVAQEAAAAIVASETEAAELLAAQEAARGNPRYTLYRMPRGAPCAGANGERYQCFTFEEYRTMVLADIDLRFAEQMNLNYLGRINSYDRAFRAIMEALDLANQRIDTVQLERDRLLLRWSEENRLRLEAENRPMLGSWVPWTLAAVAATVATTLFIVDMVE